jgi:Integrase core domain
VSRFGRGWSGFGSSLPAGARASPDRAAVLAHYRPRVRVNTRLGSPERSPHDLKLRPFARYRHCKHLTEEAGGELAHLGVEAADTAMLVVDALLDFFRERDRLILRQDAGLYQYQAEADVFEYIERFYNAKRRHSTIGYLSPMEFEMRAELA